MYPSYQNKITVFRRKYVKMKYILNNNIIIIIQNIFRVSKLCITVNNIVIKYQIVYKYTTSCKAQ